MFKISSDFARAGRLRAFLLATALAASTTSVVGPAPARAAEVGDFLGDPVLSHVTLSPSGKYLGMVRSDGLVDMVVVRDLGSGQEHMLLKTKPALAKLAEQDTRQRVVFLHWKSDERLIVSIETPSIDVYNREVGGFIAHLVVAREGGSGIMLNRPVSNSTRISRSTIVDSLPSDQQHLLVGLPDGSVERVDIRDNSHVQVEAGGPKVLGYGADRNGAIVTRTLLAGTWAFPYILMQTRAPGEKDWSSAWEVHRKDLRALDDIEVLGASEDPGKLWVRAKPKTPADGETYALRLWDLKTKALGPIVWSHPKYDVEDAIVDEQSGKFLGACYVADVQTCEFKDSALDARFNGIAKFFDGRANIAVSSQSADGSKWVLRITSPEEPESYYLLDVATAKLDPIGSAFPRMQTASSAQVKRFDYKARDGFALSAYVTSPSSPGPHPLVVMPHGGPEVRDQLGFDTLAQYLATRGYMVLQPNFRGSSGFGRAFAESGYGQWGGLMQDDVTDAVKAVIATGAVDAKRICVVGASYGGYVALYAAAKQSDLYRCAASIDGVSDLPETLAESREDYGADSGVYKYVLKAIGDPARDGERLKARSPARLASDVAMPVLLIHGTDDPIVWVEQSRRMNRALEAAHKTVRYVEIKGMGHGPSLDKETKQVFTEVASFLDQWIGPKASAGAVAAPAASKNR